MRAWLDGQVSRPVGREDAEPLQLLAAVGVGTADLAPRVIAGRRGALVGRVRFSGASSAEARVEVIAHDFEDFDHILDMASTEWRSFAPRSVEFLAVPGEVTARRAAVKALVYAARYDAMPSPDGRVTLSLFLSDEEPVSIVIESYRALAIEDPELRKSLQRPSARNICTWRAEGSLFSVRARSRTVGLIVVTAGHIGWLEGDLVREEIVAPAHRGRGYAASAQRAVVGLRRASNPKRPLIGAIEPSNWTARQSASRAGRRVVLQRVVVPLPSL